MLKIKKASYALSWLPSPASLSSFLKARRLALCHRGASPASPHPYVRLSEGPRPSLAILSQLLLMVVTVSVPLTLLLLPPCCLPGSLPVPTFLGQAAAVPYLSSMGVVPSPSTLCFLPMASFTTHLPSANLQPPFDGLSSWCSNVPSSQAVRSVPVLPRPCGATQMSKGYIFKNMLVEKLIKCMHLLG